MNLLRRGCLEGHSKDVAGSVQHVTDFCSNSLFPTFLDTGIESAGFFRQRPTHITKGIYKHSRWENDQPAVCSDGKR